MLNMRRAHYLPVLRPEKSSPGTGILPLSSQSSVGCSTQSKWASSNVHPSFAIHPSTRLSIQFLYSHYAASKVEGTQALFPKHVQIPAFHELTVRPLGSKKFRELPKLNENQKAWFSGVMWKTAWGATTCTSQYFPRTAAGEWRTVPFLGGDGRVNNRAQCPKGTGQCRESTGTSARGGGAQAVFQP